MAFEQGNSSNQENNSDTIILSSFYDCIEKSEEAITRVRSALVGCSKPGAGALTSLMNRIQYVDALLAQVLVSHKKTKDMTKTLTNDLTSTHQTLAIALGIHQDRQVTSIPDPNYIWQFMYRCRSSPNINPHNPATATVVQPNQAAAVAAPAPSFPQPTQVARPPGPSFGLPYRAGTVGPNRAVPLSLPLQSQVALPLGTCNRANTTPVQQNQANQAGAFTFLNQTTQTLPLVNALSSPMVNAGASFSNHIEQNNASLIPLNSHGQRTAAITPGFEQVPSSGTNVCSTGLEVSTRKRRLEELYGPNNQLPEKLRHMESRLIKRIMAEIIEQDAMVKWEDIAGLEHAKNCVQETVLWPVLNPQLFQSVCSIGKGLLLFGPPGTGKTMIGKAVAGEMEATFFNISASSLTSKWLGEGENLVRILFGLARHVQPSVIFLDEIDSVLFKRSSGNEHQAYRQIKTQLLVEMEGIDSGNEQVVVIGATNRPQDLDEAARRRLSKRLYIPLPCSQARLRIVVNMMEKAAGRCSLSQQELDLICNLTDGYSGSDMANLVRESMMGPIREAIRDVRNGKDIRQLKPEDLRPVAIKDFEDAMKEVRPSVSPEELDGFVEWNAKFGSL
ncbi:hypothetical protein PTKIN_Ptkin16aG0025300 [Pterospermum kingtungense]